MQKKTEQCKVESIQLGRVLNTTLPIPLYNELEKIAKGLATGRGHWDFGVAINYLIEKAKESDKMDFFIEKLNEVKDEIDEVKTVIIQEEDEDKEEDLGLLG